MKTAVENLQLKLGVIVTVEQKTQKPEHNMNQEHKAKMLTSWTQYFLQKNKLLQ